MLIPLAICPRQGALTDVTARDDSGKTAIHHCASADMIELLLSRDRSAVDTPDNSGHPPLHAAAMAGNVNVVEALLNHGANINAQDNGRHTAIQWAVGMCPPHELPFL